MMRQEYLVAINTYLTNNYSISLCDTGYSDAEWLSRFGDLDVEDAIEIYAEKYGLVNINDFL